MNDLTDPELLREYAEHHAEAAFGELVRRHVDLVYSAALRMVQNTQQAEDVTQGVFLALSRSADQLTDRPILSGWLHRTAQNLAANTIRTEVRRRAREREAAIMNDLLSPESEPAWEEIATELDTSLGELSEADRDALLLRYFEGKSARQMAQTLGTSEEAAQKRVTRAVDRLRELLHSRGVKASAGGLVVLLSANAVQAAPAGLALTITSSVALAGAATLTAPALAKIITMNTLQKTIIVTTLAAAVGVGTYQAREASLLRAQIKTIQQQPPPISAEALAELQNKVQALEAQNNELTNGLAQAKAEITRLNTEREQAKRSAALYQDLIEQANAKELNPTNAYPTPRHVFVALGKFGRIVALAKQDAGAISPAEKSAREEAMINALAELPAMLKAIKQYDEANPNPAPDTARPDMAACILYGALGLDEQQFSQVYSIMERFIPEHKDNQSDKVPESETAIMEQFKAEMQPVLTPEQSKIFVEVAKQFKFGPTNWSFNAAF